MLPLLAGGLARVKVVGKNGLRQVEFFPHVAQLLRYNGDWGTFADLGALEGDIAFLMIIKLMHTRHHECRDPRKCADCLRTSVMGGAFI